MKKRIFSLVMAAFMALSIFMTSCSSSSDEDEMISAESITARSAETITITLMTGDETTDEAIQAVQDAINNITKQRFKTQVVLRYFKESEYEQKLEELIEDIVIEQASQAGADEEAAAAEKEAARRAAIEKLMNKDAGRSEDGVKEIFGQQFIERETEEVTTAEHYETDLNILGSSVQRYPEASDTQLDIFLVVGTENLTKFVKDENYATDDESFLVEMDSTLLNANKELYQYINPSVLLGGKVDNKTYAIPSNRQIAYDYNYLVINNEVAESIGYDVSGIDTITSDAAAGFLQAIKEKAPDVAPMLKRVDEVPGIVQLFHDQETIFGTYVSNGALSGFKSSPKNLFTAWQFTDHYIAMEKYERNGYFAENPTEDTEFGLAIMKGNDTFPSTLDPEKYTVKVLSVPIASAQTVGEYMLGISKYTENVERSMEFITFLNTNSEMRNLIQYGIEGENYKIDVETGKLVRLNHDYMMNIYTTGNTFIAYPEEDMDLDVWEQAKLINQSTIVSPYLGFLFENEKNAETISQVKLLSDQMLQRLKEFDPEAYRIAKIAEYNAKIEEYRTAQTADRALLAIAKQAFAPYSAQVNSLQTAYNNASSQYSSKEDEYQPYKLAFTTADGELTSKRSELNEAKNAEEPNADLIASLEAEILALEDKKDKALAEWEPLKTELDALKAKQTTAKAALEEVLDKEVPASGENNWGTVEKLQAKVTDLERRINAYDTEIYKIDLNISSLNYTTDAEFDVIAEKLYDEFFSSLSSEVSSNQYVKEFMSPENENSVISLYNEWHTNMYGG